MATTLGSLARILPLPTLPSQWLLTHHPPEKRTHHPAIHPHPRVNNLSHPLSRCARLPHANSPVALGCRLVPPAGRRRLHHPVTSGLRLGRGRLGLDESGERAALRQQRVAPEVLAGAAHLRTGGGGRLTRHAAQAATRGRRAGAARAHAALLLHYRSAGMSSAGGSLYSCLMLEGWPAAACCWVWIREDGGCVRDEVGHRWSTSACWNQGRIRRAYTEVGQGLGG